MFYLSWEYLHPKQNQIPKLSSFNCFMLRQNPSLQSRCGAHWLIHFAFELVWKMAVATINFYEETVETASVARAFHTGIAPIMWCMHLIPPSPLLLFHNFKITPYLYESCQYSTKNVFFKKILRESCWHDAPPLSHTLLGIYRQEHFRTWP